MLLALCLALAPLQEPVPARPPAGNWEGRIEVANLDFAVSLRWEGETLAGTIDIPAQAFEDGPLDELSFDGEALRFRIAGVPGEPTFEGRLLDAPTRVEGTFAQSGAKMPFHMAAVASPAERAAVLLEGFDPWVEAQLKRFRIPGLAAAVVWKGEVVLARGYGIADVGSGAAVTADTLFAIGSTTKAFTAFAIAQAVEEGLLDWDAPARRYLPQLQLQDEVATSHVTLRDMCSHRTGLPRHDLLWYAQPDVPRHELVARLAHLEPTAGFREEWQYNNLMFVAAGVALEGVTGLRWEEVVHERILEPAGMHRTRFGPKDAMLLDDVARPHDRKKGKYVVLPFRDLTEVGPAGSIHSSANDMARWLAVLLGRGRTKSELLLGTAHFLPLVTPVSVIGAPGAPTAYGLGWMLDTREGHPRFHHGGAIDGFTAQVEVYPEDELAVFTVTNRAGALHALAATQLAQRFLQLEVDDQAELAAAQMETLEDIGASLKKGREADRMPDAPHARPLQQYAGEYTHPGYGSLFVQERDGALHARYGTLVGPLQHWHYEVFQFGEGDDVGPLEGLLGQFGSDLAGFVTTFEVQLDGVAPAIRFERAPDAALQDPALLARFVGEYSLLGQTVRVELRGTLLTAYISGQPPLELLPSTHGRFRIALAEGFLFRFELPEEGPATALVVTQPNGTFRATRR